jgi:excisionase family DNA binding protein
MDGELLSTGQAARLCSVTPDAVLKWVKSGRIRAQRTRGGHYRIARAELERHMGIGARPRLRYCWEFHRTGGEIRDACRRCVAYRAKALNCFELARFGKEIGHSLQFCETACEDCDFYRLMKGRVASVLLFSPDPKLIADLKRKAGDGSLNIEGAESVYEVSAQIDSFRPDFVIVDAKAGAPQVREISTHLLADPRARLEGLVLAGDSADLPDELRGQFSDRIEGPLEVEKISECIARLRSVERN